MKIYVALSSAVESEMQYILATDYPRGLVSFYYSWQVPTLYPYITHEWFRTHDFFLDCGAFTAHTKGIEIGIEHYADYIERNKEWINTYPNLDVKGDKDQTMKNQEWLERQGLTPIPVYHGSERDFKLLEELMKKYEYIAIGDVVGEIGQTRIENARKTLDPIFALNGKYKRKLHGFGVTSVDVMLRYPWYSVDSTQWGIGAGYGRVLRSNKYGLPRSGVLKLKRILEDQAVQDVFEGLYIMKQAEANKGRGAQGHRMLRYRNLLSYKELETILTELWAARGVVWDE